MSKRDTRAKELSQAGREDRVTDALSPLLFGSAASKIQSQHQERLAVVYIRQSTAHQILEHAESRVRQYALDRYAMRLGWARERIVVIDEDQGQSGRHAGTLFPRTEPSCSCAACFLLQRRWMPLCDALSG